MDKAQKEDKETIKARMCTTNCGFYGSVHYDGLCSKCFKEKHPLSFSDPIPPSVDSEHQKLLDSSSLKRGKASLSPAKVHKKGNWRSDCTGTQGKEATTEARSGSKGKLLTPGALLETKDRLDTCQEPHVKEVSLEDLPETSAKEVTTATLPETKVKSATRAIRSETNDEELALEDRAEATVKEVAPEDRTQTKAKELIPEARSEPERKFSPKASSETEPEVSPKAHSETEREFFPKARSETEREFPPKARSETELEVTPIASTAVLQKTKGGNDAPKGRKRRRNPCDKCGKKLSLSEGIQCRCGGLYCGLHRYTKEHQCTFDYKTMGEEEIRRNNPVVLSDKVTKI